MTAETVDKNQETPYEIEEILQKKTYGTDFNYKHKIVWQLLVGHVALQIGWLIGFYTFFFHTKLATKIWASLIGFLAIEGIGIGAHRYYTHKSFTPSFPLRVALIICQTMAGQNSMFTWARDHRLHHKYSDTDADPHNSSRGLFFSHMGWLMVKKNPLLRQKGREIDVSELLQDKLVMFQHKYFLYVYFLLGMFIPVAVPVYFWNESFWSSFFVAYCLQYVTNLHITWSINSVAHRWGMKPYDKRIKAAESTLASLLTMGDGWHNFHHAFPWDYRMAENFSISANVLYILACLGLAYDLKVASPNIIHGHAKRHGDTNDQEIRYKEVIVFKNQQKETTNTMHLM